MTVLELQRETTQSHACTFLEIAQANKRGYYETDSKLETRREIFDLFEKYANIDEKAQGFFLPHDSSEILDLCRAIPAVEKTKLVLISNDDFGFMIRYELFNDYWYNLNGDHKYLILKTDLDIALGSKWVRNVTFGHADFYGNWGSKTTDTDRVINQLVDAMGVRSCFSFTHSRTARRCDNIELGWNDLKTQYLRKYPTSRFRDFEHNPTILTGMQFGVSGDFGYSVKFVGNRIYRNVGNRGWMDNTTVSIDMQDRIFSDEELYWSYVQVTKKG